MNSIGLYFMPMQCLMSQQGVETWTLEHLLHCLLCPCHITASLLYRYMYTAQCLSHPVHVHVHVAQLVEHPSRTWVVIPPMAAQFFFLSKSPAALGVYILFALSVMYMYMYIVRTCTCTLYVHVHVYIKYVFGLFSTEEDACACGGKWLE